MSKAMTPSEIANFIEEFGFASGDVAANAVATIRELEADLEIVTEALVQSDLKIRSLPNTDQSDVEFIHQALDKRKSPQS